MANETGSELLADPQITEAYLGTSRNEQAAPLDVVAIAGKIMRDA